MAGLIVPALPSPAAQPCQGSQAATMIALPTFCKSMRRLRFARMHFRGESLRPVSMSFPLLACRLLQIVAVDNAALHHELDALHFGDICERIAGNADEIGVPTFLDYPNLLTEIEVQGLSGRAGGSLQSLSRRHAPLHI